MEVHPTHLGLDNVKDYVERSFRPLAEQKTLGFEISMADDLPKSLETDEQRLQQILKNLLSNAFKFTEQGGVTLRMERAPTDMTFNSETLNKADGVLSFAVADSGIGIPEDKLKLIFEAFQQADGTTSRKYGGTGLGLSISREIARLLGGEIRATSTVGEGSTFVLYLPDKYVPLELPGPGVGPATFEFEPINTVGRAGARRDPRARAGRSPRRGERGTATASRQGRRRSPTPRWHYRRASRTTAPTSCRATRSSS